MNTPLTREFDSCIAMLSSNSTVRVILSEDELEHIVWMLKAAYYNGSLLTVADMWDAAQQNPSHAAYIAEHARKEIAHLFN